MQARWVDQAGPEGVLHHRAGHVPRWDLRIARSWPVAPHPSRRRYARQIRQDVWRAARGQRGFVPMVLVSWREGELTVLAGGTLRAGGAAGITQTIAAVLDDPANRRRWDAHAAQRPKRRMGDPCSKRS
ncbi:MAG: hypothetical protein AAFR17_15660 [Pseudomonadota bacterium]